MTLRKHQSETDAIGVRIQKGEPISRIDAPITPGGGKSALPGILAERLFPDVADHLLWVVPRNSLRSQGEGDFPDWSRHRIRAAGNEADPRRGTAGYVTTYQAIAADPARHLETFSRGRWITFLDEPHHRVTGGIWDKSVAPLLERSVLTVYASGTFARGDGLPIAGLTYDDVGMPIFGGPGAAVVQYSRGDALREGAIVPVHFRHLDGRAEWEDEDGARQASSSFRDDYSPAALFTALRTEFAYELLDETVSAWRKYKRAAFPGAKLIVVAPNIALARQYLDHLHLRRIDALMASSDDDDAAQNAIARFKGLAAPATDVLVTICMAYEGLSVPAITHIACLTHIRSVPWLEQLFARGNRTAPGKVEAFVFGPEDVRLRAAIRSIEAEQVQALADREAMTDSLPAEDGEGGNGGGRPGIRPIGSAAFRSGGEGEDFPEEPAAALPDGGLTPSAAQALLRTQIARHIEIYLVGKRPGSKGSMQKIIMRKLKDLVGGKAREDCTIEELTAQWMELKKICPLKD
jgi:superfamily II DNA or RNA helicase